MKHTYVYASGKLLRETFGDTTLDFFYSTSGQPYALKHNGTTYYYITNLQGDVMQIVNGDGEVVASYQYDPYGNIISATGALAEINPLRYRGYIYDSECDLYYLQSRYYDPSMGRFLNADAYASTGQGILGYNMFAYCNNNPVNLIDPDGCSSQILEALQDVIERIKSIFTVKYDVPLYCQGDLYLCWAYCQVMVEHYVSGTEDNQTLADARARQIAKDVNGEINWNQGGWPTNCTEYYVDGTPVAAPGYNTIVDLFVLLKRGKPIYAYYSDSDSAHLVVVTGVDLLQGVVYTNNPWGYSGQQTYSEFLNGFLNGKNDGSYPFGFFILAN